MEQLKKIQKVEPRHSLRSEVLNEIQRRAFQYNTPAYLKWIAAAVVVVNLLAVTSYMRSQETSFGSNYQIFSTENIINYNE
jgi:hypothetical protein